MQHSQLVDEALTGDEQALALLVRTYQARVLRFGRRVCRDGFDAEDAVQEAFLKLARRPDVQRDRGAFSWLLTVVRNTCLRMMRPFVRRRAALDAELTDEAKTLSPEQLLERFEAVERVHRALVALPVEQRQVLLLRDIEGLSGEEVARYFGITLAAMKSRLARARGQMRAELSDPSSTELADVQER